MVKLKCSILIYSIIRFGPQVAIFEKRLSKAQAEDAFAVVCFLFKLQLKSIKREAYYVDWKRFDFWFLIHTASKAE